MHDILCFRYSNRCFVQEVEELVKSKVYEAQKEFIKVRKSTLNEDSGLIGAAYLAFSK